jgi:hypothetical protein
MYWWVLLWLVLGAAACIGVLYLVYMELFPEAEKEKPE